MSGRSDCCDEAIQRKMKKFHDENAVMVHLSVLEIVAVVVVLHHQNSVLQWFLDFDSCSPLAPSTVNE